jgi:glycosyltransferase involved in cell wall biosynthesis
VSDCAAQFDEALGLVRNGKVARIYNGVDLTRPLGDGRLFRGKYSIPENRAVVLGVSWMIPEKGILDLLDAAKLVLSSNPDVHFVMVGEGPYRPQHMEYAAQTGIADHVTWTGLVEDPIAEGAYDAADVFCQLSRWQEAFGFVIAEAMACRKPVIGTSVGGIPEIVQNGTAGFRVPPRQPAVAAQRILQLLGDAPLRRRMGDAGRARVEELFDLRRTVADLIALYGISR